MEILLVFTMIGILHFLRVLIYYLNDRNSKVSIDAMPELALIGLAIFLGIMYFIFGFPDADY